MKPIASVFWLTLGFCFSALMTGCVSSGHRTAQSIEPARDFEVVETSARRPLTDKEMGELRGTVAHYLDEQGQTDTGDYYLKVYLTPEAEGANPDWVVVRFTRYTDTRVALASAYPGYDTYGSYYSYDTYPYGYGSFGRISLQYYDDPFYRSRYYYPRRDWRDRDRDHHHPGDHKPGDRPTGNGPVPPGSTGNNPPRSENWHRRYPDRIAPNTPHPEIATQPPGTTDPRIQNRRAPQNPSSRPAGPGSPADHQWRGRNEANGNPGAPRPSSAPRTEARNEPPRSSQPSYRPSAPDRTPPASSRSNTNSDRREDGRRNGNLP